jgi:polysaccharide export outer membrane protein
MEVICLSVNPKRFLRFYATGICFAAMATFAYAQNETSAQRPLTFQGNTTQEYNERIEKMRQALGARTTQVHADEYKIGPDDLLEITVFEAPELNGSFRVSAGGEISLSLLGAVKAAGLTPQELESVLDELLRRSYLKDPHVGVFVREMQSHPVSVMGAVKKPGVFQIRGSKSLLEMLSMAEGLSDDAGDTVLVMRGASFPAASVRPPAEAVEAKRADTDPPAATPPSSATVEVNLKDLLNSDDPRYNVSVYPGDIVKVTRAGIIYVMGDVKKPGGFVMRDNESISAVQALALSEGLTRTSARSQARIIRTDETTGARKELPIDLKKVLEGKATDSLLQPRDILFVPISGSRNVLYRGLETAVSIGTGVAIYRRY